jgi:hypothetical protein
MVASKVLAGSYSPLEARWEKNLLSSSCRFLGVLVYVYILKL